MRVEPGSRPILDGVPIELPSAGWPTQSWLLLLPPGKHVVQLQSDRQPVLRQTNQGFLELYQSAAAKHRDPTGFNYTALLAATRPILGMFREPLLPHFWGNYFWEQKQPQAAIRFWKWSVRVAPEFAPAHLNLAYALHQQGETKLAHHELALAKELNVQDTYGISEHLIELRTLLDGRDAGAASLVYDPADYLLAPESLSPLELRAISAIQMAGTFSYGHLGKARVFNNIGAYLLHRLDKPHLALEYFFRATEDLIIRNSADIDKECATMVLSNIQATMNKLGMVESTIYSDLGPE